MILVLAFDLRAAGGIERLSAQVCNAMIEADFDVQIVEYRHIGNGSYKRLLGRAWFIIQTYWYIFMSSHVICMHAFLLRPLRLWHAIPGCLKRQRVLCWLHGIEVWGSLLETVKGDLLLCDSLAASSYFTKDKVSTSTFGISAINVIHPSSDFEEIYKAVPPPTVPRLLTVARISSAEKYKGHDQIMESLWYLKSRDELSWDLKWRVVGKGDDVERLQERAVVLGLEKWIDWVGSLTDSQLVEEYQNCSVLVMPSLYRVLPNGTAQGEGFGITYLEAALAGRPSIAGISGGQTDIVKHLETGWLVDRSTIQLSNVIREIQLDLEQAHILGMRARSNAVNMFSRKVQKERILNWLQS